VMNRGIIEQMGAPSELYENPKTTFVANFLGQSNLLRGTIGGRSGADVLVDVQGHRLLVPADRAVTGTGDVWLGVRPEKMSVRRTTGSTPPAQVGAAPAGGNVLTGTVTDASFVGVSTQYLVRLPWGQEVMVFAQNRGREALLRPGDEAELRWHREHTFLLDAAQDALAGALLDEEAVVPDPVGAHG
jgi:spermidine/putrescine transport system ATP-binding protein